MSSASWGRVLVDTPSLSGSRPTSQIIRSVSSPLEHQWHSATCHNKKTSDQSKLKTGKLLNTPEMTPGSHWGVLHTARGGGGRVDAVRRPSAQHSTVNPQSVAGHRCPPVCPQISLVIPTTPPSWLSSLLHQHTSVYIGEAVRRNVPNGDLSLDQIPFVVLGDGCSNLYSVHRRILQTRKPSAVFIPKRDRQSG